MNLDELARLADTLGLSEPQIAIRLRMLGLTPQRRDDLAAAWKAIQSNISHFIQHLYELFLTVPQLQAILTSEQRIEKLKRIQREYLQELVCSPLDRGYVLKRLQIGLVHHRMRITPQWYLAAYAHYLVEHIDLLLASTQEVTTGRERLITLIQTILFDASLVLDAYGLKEQSLRLQTAAGLPTERNIPGTSSQAPSHADPHPTGSLGATISRIRLTTDETDQRAAFIGLQGKEIAYLASLQSTFTEHSDRVLDDFYRFLQSTPELADRIQTDQVDRLIAQVRSYWQEFLEGSFDRPYAASRMRIGVIHEQIGVTPQLYIVALARQVAGFLRAIPVSHDNYADTLKSFVRALFFDITFIIDAYMEARAETLFRTEGYASQLMASLSASIVVIDTDQRIQFANSEFVGLVGIEPALLCQMQLVDALPLIDLRPQLQRMLGERLVRATELYQWGSHLFRISAIPLDNAPSLRPTFYAILLDDVSDLLRMSRDMELNVSHFDHLANSVTAVLWEMDFATKTIETISRHALELTGHRDSHFLGKVAAWFNCVAEEDRERLFVCCATLDPGSRRTCDYRLHRADDKVIWVRSYLARIAVSDTSVRIAAITVDITQTRRSDELRFGAISQVSGGIAHVLNNSLTVIVNNLEMHAISLGGRFSSPFLHESLKACQQAASVAKKLQAFAGGQVLRPSTLTLHEALQPHLASLQELFGNAIQLSVTFPSDPWLCRIDPLQFSLALQHVCENALNAMPLGGRVTITVCNIAHDTLSFDDPGFNRDWVALEVVDTGCGMSDEVRRRAVEPFFGTSPSAERRGLGLSFVYGFVLQSGGHMLLTSIPGVGTTVMLRFPKHELDSHSQYQSVNSETSARVLIVDDDEAVAQVIASQIRLMGFRAHVSLHVHEAFEVLAQHAIDLVLTDIVLGEGIDGLEMAKRMVVQYPNIKVIIMSGYAHDRHSTHEMPPAWQFLAKPFSAKMLQSTLASVGFPSSMHSRPDHSPH